MSLSNPIRFKPVNVRLLWFLFIYWLYVIVIYGSTVFVNQTLITKGMAGIFTELKVRLSKLPGLAFLDLYSATYKLTLANVACIIPLTLSFVSMRLLLDLYLRPTTFDKNFSRWESPVRLRRVVLIFCVSILIGDAILFGCSFMLGWGMSKNPTAAILASVVYQACIGMATLCEMFLSERISAIREEGVRNETVS